MRLIPLCLLLVTVAAHAENLAPQAAYSAVISGFVYHDQVIPGTNTPAPSFGFRDAPPWQGPPLALIDGRRDGDAVTSWYWSAMPKHITVTFDLRRPAKISALRVWPRTGSAPFDGVTARFAETEAGLDAAQDVPLTAGDGGFAWRGASISASFVRIVCASGAPQMALAEVEIEGEATGPVIAGAPQPGLIPVPPRDLAALTKLPEMGPAEARPLQTDGPAVARPLQVAKLTLTSTHYDGKLNRMVDDTCARDGDPTGRTLLDGDAKTVVNSFADWYAHKTMTVRIDLGRACDIERVVVWSAGHGGPDRTYVNAFQTWLQPVPGAAWTPLGETRNPVLPAEVPGPQYPLFTGPLGKPAQIVRLRLDGVAQSADVMRISEIEVWGKPHEGPLAAKPLKLIKPIPPIAPVALTKPAACYDWILRDRLRGMYGYEVQSSDTALLERTKQAGFNCFIFHTSGPKGHSEEGWKSICATWAGIQQQYGYKVIVSWPFGSDERYGNAQFGAYQPGGRTEWKRTPCPLSEEYWNRVIGDRAEVAARAGLTGLVADMEMYSGDSTRYQGPCCCDRCWGSFVTEHLEGVAADDVPLGERAAWLTANELSADYARRQELAVMALLRAIEQRVHALKPDFLLGYLLDMESLPGLARGFGTPTMPALIFSETEYGGSLAGLDNRLARLKNEGYPALYMVGLTPTVIKADAMAKLSCDAAFPSAGYWVWSSLAYDDAPQPGYDHRPEFKAEDYWQAAQAGHEALTKSLLARN